MVSFPSRSPECRTDLKKCFEYCFGACGDAVPVSELRWISVTHNKADIGLLLAQNGRSVCGDLINSLDEMRFYKPKLLITLAGDLGKDVCCVGVAHFGGTTDVRTHRFAELRQHSGNGLQVRFTTRGPQ